MKPTLSLEWAIIHTRSTTI